MNFEYSADEQAFRAEVRQFLKENLPKEISEKIWLVSFMQYDLGFFDHESVRVECAPNPFEAKVLPM